MIQLRLTENKLRALVRILLKESAKNHPLNKLAHKQQATWGHGEIVNPEDYESLINKGIEFTTGTSPRILDAPKRNKDKK
jgi:hypothetical protein